MEKPVAPAAAEPAANAAGAAEEAVPQVETEPAEAETGDDFTAEEAAAKAKAFLQEVLKNMGIDVVIEKMIKSDKVLLHLQFQRTWVSSSASMARPWMPSST